jgi:hypothetical protein
MWRNLEIETAESIHRQRENRESKVGNLRRSMLNSHPGSMQAIRRNITRELNSVINQMDWLRLLSRAGSVCVFPQAEWVRHIDNALQAKQDGPNPHFLASVQLLIRSFVQLFSEWMCCLSLGFRMSIIFNSRSNLKIISCAARYTIFSHKFHWQTKFLVFSLGVCQFFLSCPRVGQFAPFWRCSPQWEQFQGKYFENIQNTLQTSSEILLRFASKQSTKTREFLKTIATIQWTNEHITKILQFSEFVDIADAVTQEQQICQTEMLRRRGISSQFRLIMGRPKCFLPRLFGSNRSKKPKGWQKVRRHLYIYICIHICMAFWYFGNSMFNSNSRKQSQREK